MAQLNWLSGVLCANLQASNARPSDIVMFALLAGCMGAIALSTLMLFTDKPGLISRLKPQGLACLLVAPTLYFLVGGLSVVALVATSGLLNGMMAYLMAGDDRRRAREDSYWAAAGALAGSMAASRHPRP